VAFCCWGTESSGALWDVVHRLSTDCTQTVHRLHTFTMSCPCRLHNMPPKNSVLFPAPVFTKLTNAQKFVCKHRTECHPNKTNKFKSAGVILLHAQLTFQSLPVTLRTTKFNIQKFYIVITWNLCVLYGSRNKQLILPFRTLKDWFL